MKKIQSFLVMLIAIVSLFVLVSCGSKATVNIVNVTTMRTRIGLTIKVDDPDGDITDGSIVARLYNTDDDLVSSLVFDELAEKEETKTFDSLSENTTYRLVVKATVNDKSVTYLKANYTTDSTGENESNPVIIKTVDEFKDITYDNDAYYRLDADLDFADVSGDATEFSTIFNKTTQFKGQLDGNGHTISNLKITNSNVYCGIFGYIGTGATVKNLNITNVEMKSTKGSELYLGVLAGCNEGTISNVNIDNIKITHEGSGTTKQYIGGLVGVNTFRISNSSVKNVTMTLRSRLSSIAGGFVGTNGGIIHTPQAGAYIKDCSATNVEITTNHEATRAIPKDEEEKEYIQYTGGFVGETRIDIKDSYAEAKINAKASFIEKSFVKVYSVAIGGFAGRTINGCKIEGVASASNITFSTKDAYSVNVGVLVGAAYDTLFKNCYAVLTGENSVVDSASYLELDEENAIVQEVLDAFEKNFSCVGKIGDVLTDVVSTQENIGYVLATDATIITEDTEEITGHMNITGDALANMDLTKVSDAVKTFLESVLK
ncbi:MAG: GLUG motif-containing protein [Anaeroplasmataceae bacterium]